MLTHVARNADAMINLLTWARTGVPTPAYSEHASSATRTSRPVPSARPRRSAPTSSRRRTGSPPPCGRCRRRPGRRAWSFRGRRILASDVLWLRAREVWIHAIDLDAGASFGDLPRPMLRELLTDAAVTLGARPDFPRLLLAPTDESRTWTVGEVPDRTGAARGPRARRGARGVAARPLEGA